MSADSYAAVRKFLAAAEIRPDFSRRAMGRIEKQHDELGDSFKWCVRGRLISEAIEECEDLAAWSALSASRCEQDAELLGAASAHRVRALLTIATERADEADSALVELRRLLERSA